MQYNNITANARGVICSHCDAEHNEWQEALRIQEAYKSVTYIYNQLMQALPTTLLNELEDDVVGLQNVTMIDIFGHCLDCRGTIDNDLIIEYQKKHAEPLNAAN